MLILVPMDGSAPALRALDHAITLVASGGGEIRVLNVQPPIPSSVGDFVGSETVARYQSEEGEKALAVARERLAGTGVTHRSETRIGTAAETIAAEAADAGCDQIVMGSRGMGGIPSLLLGSVATRVLYLADVPVTIVK